VGSSTKVQKQSRIAVSGNHCCWGLHDSLFKSKRGFCTMHGWEHKVDDRLRACDMGWRTSGSRFGAVKRMANKRLKSPAKGKHVDRVASLSLLAPHCRFLTCGLSRPRRARLTKQQPTRAWKLQTRSRRLPRKRSSCNWKLHEKINYQASPAYAVVYSTLLSL
jgi:hypothetical protein